MVRVTIDADGAEPVVLTDPPPALLERVYLRAVIADEERGGGWLGARLRAARRVCMHRQTLWQKTRLRVAR